MDPVQQRPDGSLAMVTRDVCVQVEPEALDPVLVRAVRRQKVEPPPIAELGQPGPRHAALVDDVVVVDHVDRLGVVVGLDQRSQQVEEYPAGLASPSTYTSRSRRGS